MTILCSKTIMCQPVNGQIARTTQCSNFGERHAHSTSSTDRTLIECAEGGAFAGRKHGSGDELNREDIELRHVNKLSDGERRRRALVTFAEAPVRSGDTLVTIALKYGCRVSELKQLNRLIRDQDVFGLRTIRVPVKRYGVVEELVTAEMKEEQSNINFGVAEISSSESSDNETADDDEVCDGDAEGVVSGSQRQPLLQHGSSEDSHRMSRQARQALRHLHAVDCDVRTVVSAVNSSRTFCRSTYSPVVSYRRRQDAVPFWTRVRWWAVVIGLTFVLLPLLFVLYLRYIKSD